MEICIGASAVAADVTSVKKKEGKKKREKNATYEQIFAPASNNGTTEHPSPLYVHLPPCLDSVIKQTFTISLLFPTTRVVFRYLPPNRDITPLSPSINRQFDHRHRIGKRLPNAWKRTHTHTRSTRVQSRVLEFFRSLEENYTGDLSRMYRRGINIEQVVPWGGKEMASRPFSSHRRIGSNR